METFANQAVTTLSATITTTTAASCSVIDAAAFPATGNFRIKIDGEILIVTGVAGNTFTVTRGAEGTTAATHASGASVIHLLTKGGLEARVANRFISDIYDNKPAAGVKGRLFLPTDGLFLEYDDGSAWQKYGPYRRLKAPPQTGWSWVNQGNATVNYVGGALVLEDPECDATLPQLRILVRPILEATTVTMAFTFNGIGSDVPFMGLCLRQEGGTYDGFLYGYGVYSGSSMWVAQWRRYNSPTSLASNGDWDDYLYPQRLIWWRCQLAGDRRRIWYSADGVNWIMGLDDSISSYFTPTQFGIFIDPTNNAQPVSMSLVHWEES
jgi:hypothetical protein